MNILLEVFGYYPINSVVLLMNVKKHLVQFRTKCFLLQACFTIKYQNIIVELKSNYYEIEPIGGRLPNLFTNTRR